MSDNWIYYPCQMGENRAFIYYNETAKEQLENQPELNHCLRIEIDLKHPREDGLPQNHEHEALYAYEDLLVEKLAPINGIYTGRVTVSGLRYFYCYLNPGYIGDNSHSARDKIPTLLKELQLKTGYKATHLLELDLERDHFHNALSPTDNDWQVINDIKVLEALEKHGDQPNIPREIDHWIFFKTPEFRENYQQWARNSGFQVRTSFESEDKTEPHPYTLQIYKTACTTLEEISHITLTLKHKADEMDAEYDGWETPVKKSPDTNIEKT